MNRKPQQDAYRDWRRAMGICTPAPGRAPAKKPAGAPKEMWPAHNKKRRHGIREVRRQG